MKDAIETIEVKNLTVKIFQDSDAESPRGHAASKMNCIISRYSIGDQHGFKSLGALLKHVHEIDAVFLPIYHADMRTSSEISTDLSAMVTQKIKFADLSEDASEDDYDNLLDQGQCGVIFMDADALKEVFGSDNAEARAQALQCMQSEIAEYNQYLSGDVYGFVVERSKTCDTCEHTESEEIDSCWGFYGLEYARKEGVDTAKHTIKTERKKRKEKPSPKQIDTGKPQAKGYVRQERHN